MSVTFDFLQVVQAMANPSLQYSTTVSDTTDQSTYTFNSVAMPATATGRLIVVTVVSAHGATGDISGITFNGNAMTLVNTRTSTAANIGMFSYQDNGSTTANIVVSYLGTQSRCVVSVYGLYDLSSTTVQTSNNNGLGASSISTDVTGSADGIILSVAHRFASTTGSFTAGISTEDVSSTYETAQRVLSGHTVPSGTGTVTCTATWGTSGGGQIVAAVWR